MFTDNLSGYLRPQQIQHVNIHRPKTGPVWVKNTVDFKNEALLPCCCCCSTSLMRGLMTKKASPKPTNPKLYSRVKSEAKKKFKVTPSAYSSAWIVREYKKRGVNIQGRSPHEPKEVV